MIDGNFILLIFLVLLNILLMVIRLPLLGLIVSFFTIAMGAIYFLDISASTLPANPYTTFFLITIAGISIIVNGAELK